LVLNCALWTSTHHGDSIWDLFGSEVDAADHARRILHGEEGEFTREILGVQFSDGRTIAFVDWADAINAAEMRWRDALNNRPRVRKLERIVRDPFRGCNVNVWADENAPEWLGMEA
jgi:hypothetical protein